MLHKKEKKYKVDVSIMLNLETELYGFDEEDIIQVAIMECREQGLIMEAIVNSIEEVPNKP